MKRRVVTKIGDIFSVQTGEKTKKHFQLIACDRTQLNSDVIRAFKTTYPFDQEVDLSKIVSDEVDFYAHCITKWGVKLGYWDKVGRSDNVGSLDHILFRGTQDYGHKDGEEPIRVSNSWYVWRINEPFRDIGKLTGINRNAEIGVVMDPISIVNRIQKGEYGGFYPDFE
ncbi:MAG: hypothetical protein AB7J13_10160 [Pyrinomonadaceae bacterium]